MSKCDKPDRHEPKLKCGYLLPCPWHSGGVLPMDPDVHATRQEAARMLAPSRSLAERIRDVAARLPNPECKNEIDSLRWIASELEEIAEVMRVTKMRRMVNDNETVFDGMAFPHELGEWADSLAGKRT